MTNEEAIRWLNSHAPKNPRKMYGTFVRKATDMAIEALQERKTGKWVKDEYGTDHCSCCSYIPAYDTAIDDIFYSPFCPVCGAKMEVDDDSR